MKATRYLALAPIVTLALAGCGGSSGTPGSTAAAADCSSAEVFCIGLVTDQGKLDDKSFNQSAWEGVQEAAKGISGAKTKALETTDGKDYGPNIKQFTDAKYDVVVTVGYNLGTETTKAAAANPNTKFIGVDQFQAATTANLTGLVFVEDQAGYMAGFLAGKLTKTNIVGQVLGSKIPPVEKYALGFEAGAKAANPAVQVKTVYHPADGKEFNDSAWGAAEAAKQLDNKADVIFGAGGKTGNGALGEVAKAPGAGTTIYCIGVDDDQWNTVPEAHPCLVSSAMKLIKQGTTDLVKAAKDGSIKGGNFTGGAALAPYHDFDSKLPADVKTAVEKVVADLSSGALKTGVSLG